MLKTILEIKNKAFRYWLSQLSGWGVYATINAIVGLVYFDRGWRYVVSSLSIALFGIAATHITRRVIKREKWVTQPYDKIITKVLTSTVIMSVTVWLLVMLLRYAIGVYDTTTLNQGEVIIQALNITIVILLWMLVYLSFHYFENYEKVEIERLVWEAAVKDFELKTLKSQLNPHFMFNALNGIRALVGVDPAQAKTAITQLSNIFRYSLKIERTETVPLEEEIKTVLDYLSLEKIRFEERLSFNVEMDPKAKNVAIPPMMIQTLVENGLKHGISKIPEGGSVSVKTELKGEMLEIHIRNSGQIDEDAVLHASGHGISNTKQRLDLMYAGKGHFAIKNNNGFVEADIKLPIGGKRYESLID